MIQIGNTAFYYYDTNYKPGFGHFATTTRGVTGQVLRAESLTVERTYDFRLFGDRAAMDALVSSFTGGGTVVFIDERGTSYSALFMNRSITVEMAAPMGYVPCNTYYADVQLLIDATT